MEPERIFDKNIIVVGGGDSAIESALLLADNNNVSLLVRTDNFTRCKPKNRERVTQANNNETLKVIFSSNLVEITDEACTIKIGEEVKQLKNDLVYIFAGGVLPTAFLEKPGVKITKRFGYIMKKH